MRGIVGRSSVASLWSVLAIGCSQEPDRRDPFGVASAGSVGSVGSVGSTTPIDEDTDGDSSSSEGGSDDDDDSSPASGPVDDDGSASATMTSATTSPADATTGDPGTGDPVLDACLEIAQNECESCGCELCLDPLYACQQDPGCVAMRDCAEQSGCAGVDCLEPCGPVIDMYGGPFGSSGELALALSDCLTASCPSCF